MHSVPAALVMMLLVSACTRGGGLPEPEMRYRGDYTRGHEVNTFCPQLSSRCYWVTGDTPDDVVDALAAVAERSGPEPYAKSCIVVTAEVDSESPRQGFAADYDGLIRIDQVHGDCDQVAFITQGDIAHRRWVATLPERFRTALTPTLDFGQRIDRGVFVEGNDGCHEFNAVVLLRDTLVEFSELELGRSQCLGTTEEPVFDPREPGSLVLRGSNRLQLTTSGVIVQFDLQDWVR